MALDNFIEKYSGKQKGFPDDSQYSGECLSIVKLYILEEFGIYPPPSGTNSAYGYWSKFPDPLGQVFEKIENTPTAVPQKGDIIIWKPWTGNQYGHIEIFYDGDANSFRSFGQNWGGKQAHIQEHNYDNVIGWLHPRGGNVANCDEVRNEYNQKIYHAARNMVFELRNLILGRSGHATEAEIEADAQWTIRDNGDSYNLQGFARRILDYYNSAEAEAYRQKLIDDAIKNALKGMYTQAQLDKKIEEATKGLIKPEDCPKPSASSSPSPSPSKSPSASPSPEIPMNWLQKIVHWLIFGS